MFQPFGPWAEWACLAAIDTLALACLAAASALPRERWAGGVLVFAAGFLLPFFFSATPTGSYAAQYVNAMADLPLAMLFGGTLCLYFAVVRRKIAYWLVALPLAVLTLTKDICFAYGLITAFLIGLDLWLAADEPCRKAFPKALLRAGALAVIVLAAFSSWGRYTAAVTPTADTAASVGSEGLSYGAVLVGGVKQLLGMGRTEKFAQIMAAMRKTLRENGRDESIADEAEKTYKQKKNALIKELTSQAYSGGDGSGQSGKWLAEHADGNIVD